MKDQIGPAGEREQRPDQKPAEFFQDEGEDEEENETANSAASGGWKIMAGSKPTA